MSDLGIYASQLKPIIPPSLKPNVLGWWDAGQKKDVVYPLNQLVTNGDFSNGTTGWTALIGNISLTSNILSLTGNGMAEAVILDKTTNETAVSGNKIYLSAFVKVTNSDCNRIEIRVFGTTTTGTVQVITISNPVINQLYNIFGVVTIPSDMVGLIKFRLVHYYATAAISIGKVMEIYGVNGVLMYNLSTPFGVGNEPTASEFRAILTADGNQYWEGVRNVKCNPDNKYYWYDYSGNGRHMKLNNFAYTPSSGWVDTAPKHLKGDGVDDWVGRAESGFIAQDADFSYMTVLSPNSDNTTTATMGALLNDFSTGLVSNIYYGSGNINVFVYDRVSGLAGYSYGSTLLSTKFYFISITYTQSDKKLRLYIDGILVATTGALTNGHNTINFIRNFRNGTGASYYGSKLGIDAWFNKSLSADEVKALYNANCTRYGLAKI